MPSSASAHSTDSLTCSDVQSQPLLADADSNERICHSNEERTREGIHPSSKSLFCDSVVPKWIRLRWPDFWLWSKGRESDRNGDIEQAGLGSRRRKLLISVLCLCRRSRRTGLLLFVILSVFIMLGFIQFISLAYGVFLSFFPSYIDETVDRWGRPGEPGEYLAHWPTDKTADITPVACHSHNDYWRRVPLYSAIQAGCIGVEADVWLFDNELYVGHTKSSLGVNRTLTSLYIDPLVHLLDKQNPRTRFQPDRLDPPNGIFDTKPSQTLALLVDFKTNGHDIWPRLTLQLSPLRSRGYLTHFNGTNVIERPITVVATGNAPFDLVMANSSYRDIFFDAPLAELAVSASTKARTELTTVSIPYNHTNSYYASVSFHKSIGFPWRFQLSEKQRDLVRAQIKGAHDRGLKVRYWDTPVWPYTLRNQIWTDLVREGVDYLNVDDLKSATKKDWSLSWSW